jgi:hypothetical protein
VKSDVVIDSTVLLDDVNDGFIVVDGTISQQVHMSLVLVIIGD